MQPFTALFPNFMTNGAPPCGSADPDAFYPEMGRSDAGYRTDPADVRLVKKICAGCQYREPCLEWALDNDERFGIWGGLTVKERLVILRARGRNVPRR